MTIDEYKNLSTALTNADTAADTLLTLMDNLEKDLAERDSLKSANDTLTEQLNTVRDANTRLALRVMGNPPTPNNDTPPEKLEGKAAIDDLVNRIKQEEQ
ncbi:MAG: hypothetical protein NC131_11560 [Roseburia sp.]|nr:hypothetical protein [Roseburia sp.]